MSEDLPKLELHIVQLIEDNLRTQQMDAARAKSVAAEVLEHLKAGMTEFQLYRAAEALSVGFPELASIAAEAEGSYEGAIRNAVVRHASQLLVIGNVDQAAALLENALAKNQEIRIDGRE